MKENAVDMKVMMMSCVKIWTGLNKKSGMKKVPFFFFMSSLWFRLFFGF